MLCPLKFSNGCEPLCDKDKCGFYSGEKCAVVTLSDVANELAELKFALNHAAETLDGTNTRLTLVAATINTARIFKR